MSLLHHLPSEVFSNIHRYLDENDLCHLASVSKDCNLSSKFSKQWVFLLALYGRQDLRKTSSQAFDEIKQIYDKINAEKKIFDDYFINIINFYVEPLLLGEHLNLEFRLRDAQGNRREIKLHYQTPNILGTKAEPLNKIVENVFVPFPLESERIDRIISSNQNIYFRSSIEILQTYNIRKTKFMFSITTTMKKFPNANQLNEMLTRRLNAHKAEAKCHLIFVSSIIYLYLFVSMKFFFTSIFYNR